MLNALAQTPEWIWHAETNSSTVFFRKAFRIPPQTWNSRLTVTADDAAEVFLNGVLVARCTDWHNPSRSEVTVRLFQGENVLAVKARNKPAANEPRGLLVHLNVGGELNFVSDGTWLSSTNEEANWPALAFNAAHWRNVASLGEHGMAPWGEVLFRAAATHPDSITVAEGFKVELLRSAEPAEGSWICMTFDDKGRIIISPQGEERPLLRVTLAGGKVATVEKFEAPIRYAMGLLQAFDSLYVNGIGPQGAGLYRLIDVNRNDRYEAGELHLLKKFEGGSEHGYHALALGPDEKIYVLNGNGTKLPEGLSAKSPYRNYAEDALTGERGDEIAGTRAPNCYVLRTDAEGKEWELFAGGMRNAYDMDFNAEGELFTFDSDNEWDWGVPWYRPTRIAHLVSGGEAGWRDGTRMWAEHYRDAVRTRAYIGIGSPTGVKFCKGTNFPPEYRGALFVQDWSYGRILAIGAAAGRNFLSGAPLNLTSLAFGPDGAMYFITGGRGTQSGLYRVSYVGKPGGENAVGPTPEAKSNRPVSLGVREPEERREIRRRLEALHAGASPGDLNFIWTNLAAGFTARVALETLPATVWKGRALAEIQPSLASTALLALARVGDRGDQEALWKRLLNFPLRAMNENRKLAKLRILQVSLARHGKPSGDVAERVTAELDAEYPAPFPQLTRELARLLLALEAPGAVSKTTTLLLQTGSPEEQMFYVELLRNIRSGWSMADRQVFFSWFIKPRDQSKNRLVRYFNDVGREFVEGASFDRYLREFREEAMDTLTPEERRELAPLLAKPLMQAQMVPPSDREFVRDWKMEDLLPELGKARKPDLARGRQAFVDTQCLLCHRFGNDGGSVGPELNSAGSKYSERDLLEAIIEPSKVLSDQYQDHTVFVEDGDVFTGRLVSESEKEIVIETDRVAGTTEKIARQNVETLRPSSVSPMPAGLANVLTKEEILDLVAYIKAGPSVRRE